MDVERNARDWFFSWPTENIGARFSKLRDGKDGDQHAQIEVFSLVGGQQVPVLASTKLNLTSSRGRVLTGNDIKKRLPTHNPQLIEDIIESASLRILSDVADGNPVIDLRGIEPATTLPYLINPLLPLNETTLLYGDGEGGKSLLAQRICASVLFGLDVMGLTPEVTGPTLYLDYEDHDEGQAFRLNKILGPLNVNGNNAPFLYRNQTNPIVDDTDLLATVVAREGVALVVVDSIAWACGDDMFSASSAIRSLAAIRSLGTTALVLAHPPKSEVDGEQAASVYGSAFFRYGPRSMWELRAERAPGQIRQALYHRKANNDEKLQYPLGVCASFGPDGVTFEKMDVDPEDEVLTAALSLPVRLKRYLALHPKSTNANIEDALGVPLNQVRSLTGREQQKGTIHDQSHDHVRRWVLTTREQEQE